MSVLAMISGWAAGAIGQVHSSIGDVPARLTAADSEMVRQAQEEFASGSAKLNAVLERAGIEVADAPTRLSVFHGYIPIVVVAFFVTLIATPIMRRLAVKHGVIDRPNEARKIHKQSIAYLGGAAVFLGIMSAILYSFVASRFPMLMDFHLTAHVDDLGRPPPVGLSILLGITVIFLIGMIDDISGISPRVKVGGQLLAAAALAIDNVGVKLAAGFMLPLAKSLGIHLVDMGAGATVGFTIPLPPGLSFSTASRSMWCIGLARP